jgi:predicted ArsR family transcriptional regulator
LTDNAVRAHLAVLEREGLVAAELARRGATKPSFVYALTSDAERLYQTAYAPALRGLLDVLSERLPPEDLQGALREAGRRLAGERQPGGDPAQRVAGAVATLESLGGTLEVEWCARGVTLRGKGCPLATAVAGHRERCQLAEALVSELVGANAVARCDAGERPRCCFEISFADDPPTTTGASEW